MSTSRVAFISGNNGSWTNTDDVKNVPGSNRRRKGRKAPQKQTLTGNGMYSLKTVRQLVDRAVRASIDSGARAAATAAGVPQASGLAASGAIELYNRAAKFIKGNGMYTNADDLVHNALFDGKFHQDVKFAGDMNHMALTGEETICTVSTGSVAGAEVIITWELNPGDSGFLPKLANTCSGFTRYRPGGMYFKFIPSMGADSANGNYAFKCIYNPGASRITTFLEATDDTDSVTAQLGQAAICGVECDPATLGHDWLLLRDGTLTDANGTIVPLTECDIGTMTFALKPSTSVGANVQVGYIKVGYFLTVTDPKAIRSRPGSLNFANIGGASGVTASTPFGTVGGTGVRRRHIGSCSSITLSETTLSFPGANLNDYYRVRIAWHGAASAVIVPPAFTYTGCSAVTYMDGASSTTPVTPGSGTTSIRMQIDGVIKITSAEPTVPSIALGTAGTLPAGACSVYVEVHCIGNALPTTAI